MLVQVSFMPTTPTINIQQILQMGSHTEKLQQTLQTLPNVTAQQVVEERKLEDELKRVQVQNMDRSHLLEEVKLENREKKRLRIRKKNTPSVENENPEPPLAEDPTRGKINIMA